MTDARTSPSGLSGMRVLAVEDEALIALMLEAMLEELGCEIVGVASSLQQAFAKLNGADLDAAVLDINVGGEKIYPVADALIERNVPFLFCTGYNVSGLPERYRSHTILNKPYTRAALAGALSQLSNR